MNEPSQNSFTLSKHDLRTKGFMQLDKDDLDEEENQFILEKDSPNYLFTKF